MLNAIARTAFGLTALTAATLASAAPASAQTWTERAGITLPGVTLKIEALCVRPGTKAVQPCTLAEKRAQDAANKRKADAIRMKSEMEAEARAYRKMKDDRQRNAPTTEHCYMKNGRLECKAV